MAISFQQTDTGGDCSVAVLCSGLTLAGTPMTSNKAIQNGTAGINKKTATLAAGTTQKISWMVEIDPTGFTVSAGNWTVRINITTAASVSGSTINAIYICQVSSTCANKATIASSTGLTTSITSTGVKTFVMTGSTVTLAAGDHIEIILVFKNGSTSKSMKVSATPNQIIDTPLTVVTTSSWQQTDDSGVCGSTSLCDGLPNLTLIPDVAAVGGTGGARTNSVSVPNGTNGLSLNEIDPTGYTCPAGNWLVQFNVTVAAGNSTTVIDSCYICQIGSNCANKGVIASAWALAIPLNSTGVKTVVLAGVPVTLAPGDLIEIVLGLRTLATSDSITFVSNQVIGAPLAVVVGNIYDVDTSLDVTMGKTPALALGRAGALSLGVTMTETHAVKLDAVGRSTLAATLGESTASQSAAIAAASLATSFSCATAWTVAANIYDVSAATMTVTLAHATAPQRLTFGAASLDVTFSCSSAPQRTTQGAMTLPMTASCTSATQRNAVAAAALALTFGLSDTGGANYVVTAGTMGVTMSESSAVWTARQGSVSLSVTMGAKSSSQGNVTSSTALSVHPTISPASSANIFSATTLPTSFGFSTSSAIAAATYDKATSFAFTAGLSAPQPRLNAVGSATLAATLAESSKSQANRLAGATLPIVPGLTALTALPVQAAATLAFLFGLSSDGVKNLATVIEQLSLDALKTSAGLSARKPGADLSAGRGRTDLEAMKKTTDLDAQKDEDSLGGEL